MRHIKSAYAYANFKNLIAILEPRYPEITRFRLYYDINRLYQLAVKLVKKELEPIPFVSTSSDLWSSNSQNGFINCYVNFVKELKPGNKETSWTLSSRSLGVAFFPGHHGAANIARLFRGF